MSDKRFPGLRIIGLAGRKRVGKSTAAAVLVQEGFIEIAFAAPLKRGVAEMLGITVKEVDEYKEIPLPWLGVPTRVLLQKIGTDGCRNACPDIWVKIAERYMEYLVDEGAGKIVFSDVRFENEAAWIRDKGGLIVHIKRNEPPFWKRIFSHRSEKGIRSDKRDVVVLNNFGIGTFERVVMDISEDIEFLDGDLIDCSSI